MSTAGLFPHRPHEKSRVDGESKNIWKVFYAHKDHMKEIRSWGSKQEVGWKSFTLGQSNNYLYMYNKLSLRILKATIHVMISSIMAENKKN